MKDQQALEEQKMAVEEYEVAIIGGGMAGLTLALEIKQSCPTARILVIEKQKHPVPVAAHKVGESTVEIAAYYLREVLGLKDHLKTQQLAKFGLRMFFSAGDNQDITRRVELGHAILPPQGVGTYQLDRGLLENALGERLPQQGVTFLDNCKVQQITLQQQNYHRLSILRGESACEIQARWVVDASGRSALLKRQLGLAKKVGHTANAVWFRINHAININEWSTDAAWRTRICEGERWLSTNHLMGSGYWVWLIPLASGSISVGIVSDASMHSFEEMNRFERAIAWLQKHEPQCAAVVEQYQDKVQDFRVMKDYSYSCQQVYSSERWCLTGEAGISLDPLYSPGGDLIAISNGLISDLISKDLDGEDIEELTEIHNQFFLILTESWLGIYEKQYTIMDNPQIMATKVIWDTAVYWAVLGLLYFHDKIRRLGESPGVVVNLARFSVLSTNVQSFFREWHSIAQTDARATFIRYYDFDFMTRLQIGMTAGLPDAELEAQFAANVRFLEQLAGQLISTVIALYADRPLDEAHSSQIHAWQTNTALVELMNIYQEDEKVNPIGNAGWITLGYQSQERQEVSR
jgi:2-polyprenyl-6-methoxyphenol hydroxylase-like FAD-dependent oxidoreductase